jgi:hypothetical protein
MKALFALFLFCTVNAFAQTDSLDYYKWPKQESKRAFYSSYADFAIHRAIHYGPFNINKGTIKCRYRGECHSSTLHFSSKVKQKILQLVTLYVYDSTDLFVVFKTTPGFFANHVEICMIQNQGRCGFFERIKASQYNGVKPDTDYNIVDLKTNTTYKDSKKNLELIFKKAPDLLAAYRAADDDTQLRKYLILLNRRLGYLRENEE